jgi:hypothetical protein
VGEGTIGDLIVEFGRVPTTSEIREALDRRRPARRDSETVRVMFGSGLYEVEFCGNDVQRVIAIHYRIAFDGSVQETKLHHWSEYRNRIKIDPAIVEAARSVRASGQKDDEIPFRKAALAAFHKRRAKLISEVEKIDATIASMQCH